MVRQLSTRTRLGNSHYPTMSVNWTEDDDQNGWTGSVTFWIDGNTENPPKHTINIRQANPLGSIVVFVDEFESGCWAMTSFDGSGITERDLQWAAAYSMEALKRKRLLPE
jgi:hypothetical protein